MFSTPFLHYSVPCSLQVSEQTLSAPGEGAANVKGSERRGGASHGDNGAPGMDGFAAYSSSDEDIAEEHKAGGDAFGGGGSSSKEAAGDPSTPGPSAPGARNSGEGDAAPSGAGSSKRRGDGGGGGKGGKEAGGKKKRARCLERGDRGEGLGPGFCCLDLAVVDNGLRV